MAYFLVFLNFFMQGLLLYTIYNEVVVANIDWQNGIMRYEGKDWNLFAPPPGDATMVVLFASTKTTPS